VALARGAHVAYLYLSAEGAFAGRSAVLRGKVLLAYLVVCVAWGSTYIAIRIGVRTIPPLLFGGVRFFTAGALLFIAARAMGQALPARLRDWRVLVIVGLFLLAGGNTAVIVAEKFTPAGVASVFAATSVVWTAFFEAVWARNASGLSRRVMAGLAMGVLGTIVLVGMTPNELAHADWRGPAILTIGSALWAFGAVYYKHHHPDAGPYIGAAVQMLAAGIAVTTAGLVLGETAQLHVTATGVEALLYLVVVGSLVGYTAYTYALSHASATIVSTYTYVNPVVAVLLGWSLLGERIEARTIVGMVIVLTAVIGTQYSWRPARIGESADG
jgi:drug/metabolite transporter (DMT)-like permease